jgi:hypothetical protein
VIELPEARAQQSVHLRTLWDTGPGRVSAQDVGRHGDIVAFEEHHLVRVVAEHPGGQ